MNARIDLDKPIWNQNTFAGRVRYYAWITDPRLSFTSSSSLYNAKQLLANYRNNAEPPGTTVEQIRRSQKLYLSAFHPDSGELQNVIGRMSFYVPGGMILIGAMITFYRSNTAVIFWQWANQSFNALVNYTNRNAASDITTKRMAVAYVSATTCALVTSLGLKALVAKRASPLMQRFVPFAAVAAANMVNIPLMRQSELVDGISVFDEDGNRITESQYAAVKGISQVIFSRILMAAPSMTLIPLVFERLEKQQWMKKYGRVLNLPLQLLFSGLSLLIMVPVGCALFNQKCSIPVDKLKIMDKDKYEEVKDKYGDNLPPTLYFNKGL